MINENLTFCYILLKRWQNTVLLPATATRIPLKTIQIPFQINAGDESLKMHSSNYNRNSSMISKNVQNKVIECAGNDIKTHFFFPILCDKTADVSSKELLTICARYIDLKSCTTQEEFLGFVELKSTTSEAIKSAIEEEMLKLDLSYDYLCVQGYDGDSNMAGHLSGVQTLITKQQISSSIYPLHQPFFDLCITKTGDIPVIRNMMGTVASISTFVSVSPNRTNLLMNAIDKINNLDFKKTKALCPTWWVKRHESLITFIELLIPVVCMLEELTSNSPYADFSSKANMLNYVVRRSEFLFGLEVSVHCLSFTLRLSVQLQNPKQDLSSAVQHVGDVSDTFKNIHRVTESKTEFFAIFEICIKKYYCISEVLGFELLVLRACNNQTKRSNTSANNIEEYFRRVVFCHSLTT